ETAGRGLVIRTNPAGVKVYIDGIERGETPVVFDNMLPGEYIVWLTRDDYESRNFNITLRDNSRLTVSVEMTRALGEALVSIYKEKESPELYPFEPRLFTRAPGDVSIPLTHDNKTIVKLPTGFHVFRARAFGWEDTSVTVFVEENKIASVDIYMQPAVFKLENFSQSRRRFNPLNSGSLGITEYRFEVSAPGEGFIRILDSNGTTVYIRQLDRFDTWIQREIWNGRDTSGNLLPQGIYTIYIEVLPLPGLNTSDEDETEDTIELISLKLETEINYSFNIYPQPIDGGIAGMIFAPMARVLPARSYQFDAGFLYGEFGLSFKTGLRVAPLERFELTTVFNINPRLESQTGWGVSGSAKYNFLDGSIFPLALSAGVSYAWASNNGEYPLSPGKGIGLFVPMSLDLSNLIPGSISFIFSPALFWQGPAGIIPELLLSAGILYQGSWLTGGLSMRCEINFTGETSPKIFAGAELHIFPPPSNLFFALHGGIYIKEHTGGYGSIGIGIIY
ncbi:MAG: PEGA domain-containing protein, partial [Treponema sp.]|nr:PEGA domain-containing protein [Treponema sp.]